MQYVPVLQVYDSDNLALLSGAASHFTLNVSTGVFALTGINVSLIAGEELVVGTGSFVLTGNPVTLSPAFVLNAGLGVFAFTGAAASLFANTSGLQVASGSFTLTGYPASLTTNVLIPGARINFVASTAKWNKSMFKFTTEVFPFSMDFRDLIPPGETLQGFSFFKIYDSQQNDVTSTLLRSTAISGTVLFGVLQAGNAGTSYIIDCIGVTESSVLEDSVMLSVFSDRLTP